MAFVIDDSTPVTITHPPEDLQGRGLIEAVGYGGVAGVVPPDQFPPDLLLDDSAIQALIQEREARGNRHIDIARYYKLPCKDQNGTNYCWGNSPVYALEFVRVWQNYPLVILSPASVCAPIKGFQNQGGWGKDALRWLTDKGATPANEWPPNAINPNYYTPKNRELALDYRVTEWNELRPRDLRQCASLVLRGIPVSVGYNWWGHQVTMVDFVWRGGGVYWPIIRNSWGMGWGEDGGYAVLEGSRAYPDDAVAPRVSLASGGHVKTGSVGVAADVAG